MPEEPRKLVEARQHLKQFEQLSDEPRGINHLSEALVLLRDIIDSDEAESYKNISKNLVLTYSKNVFLKSRRILDEKLEADEEIVYHQYKIMKEFDDFGFEMSEHFKSTKDQLRKKRLLIILSQLSPYELEALLKDLQTKTEP